MVDSTKEQLLNRLKGFDDLDIGAYDKFFLQVLLAVEQFESETGEKLTVKKYLEMLQCRKS